MSAIVWQFEHSLALPFFGIGMNTDLYEILQSKAIYPLLQPQKAKSKKRKRLFKEIMVEDIPNLGRGLDNIIYEAYRSSKIFNSKRSPRHILIEQ